MPEEIASAAVSVVPAPASDEQLATWGVDRATVRCSAVNTACLTRHACSFYTRVLRFHVRMLWQFNNIVQEGSASDEQLSLWWNLDREQYKAFTGVSFEFSMVPEVAPPQELA